MSVVDDIRARLDIVDVVSGYVALQKAGRSFKAPCPFHTEKTPSFIVNPERQSWRCFGACSTGGDAFSFVMRHQNLEFGDALRLLAQKAGVPLSPTSKQDSDKRSRLHAVNRLAATFYHDRLKSAQGAAAMQYLGRRGVNAEAIAAFQLGVAPDGWDGLKTYLSNMGVNEDEAVASGLIYRNDAGRTWDFFRGRLMFPIHNRQGDAIGFGGRDMGNAAPASQGYNPKYINTASTPIFDKRNTLYGLHLAHTHIRSANTGIVVEGYMDVIAAHQRGYRNVVASMGTALTENQVAQLKSLANKFVLALDPDAAGQEATLRSLEASWKIIGEQSAARGGSQGVLQRRDPITLNIAALPDGKDPDELIRHDGAEWERLTQNALPLMSYLIPAITSRFDISSGHGKSQVVEAVFPLIAATHNIFDQQRYLQNLADALGITMDALKAGLPRRPAYTSRRRASRQAQPQPNSREQVAASALTVSREDVLEDFTLSLLLSRPQLRERVHELSPEYFRKSADREVFKRWMGCAATDELEALLDEPLLAHMQSLTQADIAPTDSVESERALDQCIQRLKRRHLLELQEELLETADDATPPSRELTAQIANLNADIKTTETA